MIPIENLVIHRRLIFYEVWEAVKNFLRGEGGLLKFFTLRFGITYPPKNIHVGSDPPKKGLIGLDPPKNGHIGYDPP